MPRPSLCKELSQLLADRDQQIRAADQKIFQLHQRAADRGMYTALDHIREALVRVINDRLALQSAHQEAERQRVKVVAVNGVERRPQTAPEHPHVEQGVKEYLRTAAAMRGG